MSLYMHHHGKTFVVNVNRDEVVDIQYCSFSDVEWSFWEIVREQGWEQNKHVIVCVRGEIGDTAPTKFKHYKDVSGQVYPFLYGCRN